MSLTWLISFLLMFRLGSSCSCLNIKSECHERNQSMGRGGWFFRTQNLQEDGLAVRILMLEGEVEAFYRYGDDEGVPNIFPPLSNTHNDGLLSTNGTATILPMRKCPEYRDPDDIFYKCSPRKSAQIHLAVIAVGERSRYDWDDYGAGLPSPCSDSATASNTTTTTATIITPSEGSGKDTNQPGRTKLDKPCGRFLCGNFEYL